MDLRDTLFSFEGRITRQPFWLFTISVLIVDVILVLVFGDGDLGTLVLGLFGLAIIWPSLAVQVKRWHDRDKSGWWILINLVPIIGSLWALVENGFLRGTVGPNRFGPDPLGVGQAVDTDLS